jgi:hypothetical protein
MGLPEIDVCGGVRIESRRHHRLDHRTQIGGVHGAFLLFETFASLFVTVFQ